MEMYNLNDKQNNTLQEFKTKVQCVTSYQRFVNDRSLIRILIAREYNLDAAYDMWLRWREWVTNYRPESINVNEMSNHIATGEAYFYGQDKKGRPCLIVRARYHFASQFTAQETIRYSIFLAESASRLADEAGIGQICMIYDRSGMTDENQEPQFISLIKDMAEVFKDFYAERLGALFILHIGVFHWLLYHAVKATIPKRTREKLHVMRNPENLTDYFEPDQLLVEYGGTSTYQHRHPSS